MINHHPDTSGLLFCGAIAVLAFFVSILYLKNRERIYLFYTVFLVCSLIYGFINISTATWVGELFGGYFYANRRLIEPITLLAFSGYILFAVELVDIGNQSKTTAKVFRIWAAACMVYSVAYFILYYAIIDYTLYVFMAVRVVIFALSAYYITWIIRHIKSPVKGPFVLGSFAYFMGSIVASIRFSFDDLPIPGLYNVSPSSYFEGGILVETLFFALALGQRFVHLVEEKQSAQEKHIEQLSANKQLISEMNKQLEEKVKIREAEIIWAQEKLNSEEKKRLKAEFDIQMAKSEMLARTLQINPHFLFNCLNSITYLIQSNQNKKAIEYLVVFSRFIRLALETSQKQVIPIGEELAIIEKYLKLEKNRFDNDFSYRISCEDSLSLKGVTVPPMLFLPVVENAVWHGLMNSPVKNKEVQVAIMAHDNGLTVTITDNGVGWERSKQNNTNTHDKQMGISMTKERIKLYNYSFDNRIDFKLIDLRKGTRTGTQAEFVITLSKK